MLPPPTRYTTVSDVMSSGLPIATFTLVSLRTASLRYHLGAEKPRPKKQQYEIIAPGMPGGCRLYAYGEKAVSSPLFWSLSQAGISTLTPGKHTFG